MNVFHHTGDLGDIVAALPVIRKLGGGELVISRTQYPKGLGPRETVAGARFDALKPLALATSYVSNISFQHPPEDVTHDIAKFRDIKWVCSETLSQWQGRYFDLNLPAAPEPWLNVDAPQHGRIVIGRTARYHTPFFPWRLIVDKYGDEILFLGTAQEHTAFQTQAKRVIEWRPTPDLLAATEVIAGARLFIGNQSVLFWIAAGLGQKLIQETHHQIYTRNSVVPRSNTFYSDTHENLSRIYDELDLDKQWLKIHPVPAVQINLSTSAGDSIVRKNLSTSAEIFQAIQKQNNEKAISHTADPQGLFAFGAN